MKFWFRVINWKLGALLAVAAIAAGCATGSKKEEEISTIRLHMEVNPQMVRRNIQAPILRAQPVTLTVAENPLLHEAYVNSAQIMETRGGHAVRLQFDRAGTRLLETETAVNLGRRLAIFAQFPEGRWLAAPVINGRITNGVLTFTPDADLAETRRLVDGLNQVAAERRKDRMSEDR